VLRIVRAIRLVRQIVRGPHPAGDRCLAPSLRASRDGPTHLAMERIGPRFLMGNDSYWFGPCSLPDPLVNLGEGLGCSRQADQAVVII
jgi:hypothetical protein